MEKSYKSPPILQSIKFKIDCALKSAKGSHRGSQKEWIRKYGRTESLTYAQVNALLFEAPDFVSQIGGQTGEVELSIIRNLEAIRTGHFVSWSEALSLAEKNGLGKYLTEHNPTLKH